VIVYGFPAGTISANPGLMMEFPDGVVPTGVTQAEATAAKTAETPAKRAALIVNVVLFLWLVKECGAVGTTCRKTKEGLVGQRERRW
jgi:hypothetical protein